MTTKIEIYNKITQKTRIVEYDYHNKSNFELITKVISDYESSPYSSRRSDNLKNVVANYETTLEDATLDYIRKSITKLSDIKQNHFSCQIPINDNATDNALASQPKVTNEIPSELVEYFSRVIQKMTEYDFETFLDLIWNFEPLVALVVQPAVILALGYQLFAASAKILCGELGGLKEIIKRSLMLLSKNSIKDSLALTVMSFNRLVRQCSGFKAVVAKTALVSTVAISLSCVGYAYICSSATKSTAIFTPTRAGGQTSLYVDQAALILEKAGAELAILTSSFSRGFGTVMLSNFEAIFGKVKK